MADIKRIIFSRLLQKYSINLNNHIDGDITVLHNADAGIDFRPKNSKLLEQALLATKKFRLDDARCSITDAMASLVTNGNGYREIVKNESGLHFQIARNEGKSNVHLDCTAFVSMGPWGPHFNANVFQHTVVDLGWTHYIVGGSYSLWKPFGKFMDGFTLEIPNLSNKMGAVGVGYELQLRDNIKLSLNHTRSLKKPKGPMDLFGWDRLKSNKKSQTMLTLGGTFDESSWFK